MFRAFALVVALVYAVVGSRILLLGAIGVGFGGDDLRGWLVLAGLTVYIYGVAAVALWFAVRPFPYGFATLVALCSPAVLIIGAAIAFQVVDGARKEAEDRARLAAAGEVWEEWASPPGVFGIPFIFDSKPLVATRNGIVESDDNGQSWTQVAEAFVEWPFIEQWAQVDDALFASVSSRRLYRSDDGGVSWTLLGVPWARDGIVFWTESGLPRSEKITALVPSGSDLYLHTYRYVFRSEDLGESWLLAYGGEGRGARAQNTGAMSLAVSGNSLLVGTFRSGIYRSQDRGESWSRLGGFPHPLVPSIATDGRSYYAIAGDPEAGDSAMEVLRSMDGGDTWEPVNRGLEGRPRELVGRVGTAMFVLTRTGVFSMGLQDTTWSKVPTPGPAISAVPRGVGPHFGVSGDRLFLLTPAQRMYRFRGH